MARDRWLALLGALAIVAKLQACGGSQCSDSLNGGGVDSGDPLNPQPEPPCGNAETGGASGGSGILDGGGVTTGTGGSGGGRGGSGGAGGEGTGGTGNPTGGSGGGGGKAGAGGGAGSGGFGGGGGTGQDAGAADAIPPPPPDASADTGTGGRGGSGGSAGTGGAAGAAGTGVGGTGGVGGTAGSGGSGGSVSDAGPPSDTGRPDASSDGSVGDGRFEESGTPDTGVGDVAPPPVDASSETTTDTNGD